MSPQRVALPTKATWRAFSRAALASHRAPTFAHAGDSPAPAISFKTVVRGLADAAGIAPSRRRRAASRHGHRISHHLAHRGRLAGARNPADRGGRTLGRRAGR